MTADGWLHTGDVGEWVDGTHVKITDRAKDIIITAGGKNVAPSEIENALKASPFIKEAIVIGDRRPYLIALIGIELETVGDWAQRRGIAYTTYRDLSEKPEVIALVQGIVDEVNARFATVEQIKKFRMLPKELDHEDGELTATQKVKRGAIAKLFAELVDDMYAGGRDERGRCEILSRGLGTGSVYALLALGFVIIYKSTRVISFAQPAFMLAGAVLVTLPGRRRSASSSALPLAALGTALLALGGRAGRGPADDRPAGVHRRDHHARHRHRGPGRRYARSSASTCARSDDPWGLKPVRLLGVEVQQRHLAMLVTTAVLVARAVRRSSGTPGWAWPCGRPPYDQEAAMAQGVSVGARVRAVVGASPVALAAVGGTFAAIGGSVESTLWLIALVALPVIILGGLDSLPGAVIGGLVVGVVQEVVANYQQYLPGGSAATSRSSRRTC